MLTAALLALAATTVAAPCVPTTRFQWASAPARSGYLAVNTSHINIPPGSSSGTPSIDNGERVFASGDYLRYVNVEWFGAIDGSTGNLQILGFNKCIDAGENPVNGSPLKVWDCYPGLMQQTWHFHDGVIELAGKNLCIDVPQGKLGNLQVWQCAQGNPNQAWKAVQS